jgi:hypothetical protein
VIQKEARERQGQLCVVSQLDSRNLIQRIAPGACLLVTFFRPSMRVLAGSQRDFRVPVFSLVLGVRFDRAGKLASVTWRS